MPNDMFNSLLLMPTHLALLAGHFPCLEELVVQPHTAGLRSFHKFPLQLIVLFVLFRFSGSGQADIDGFASSSFISCLIVRFRPAIDAPLHDQLL